MERPELNQHGHLTKCEWYPKPNRVHADGKRNSCTALTQKGIPCTANISTQSCDLQLCARHWEKHCNEHNKNIELLGWCNHLSVCANTQADENNLSLSERSLVIPRNIYAILGLPAGKFYGHLSDTRCKVARESDSRGDFDLSDSEINSDDSDDSDLDGFVANDDSEIEYYSSSSTDESDSEDERPLKRRRCQHEDESVEADTEIIDLTCEVPKRPIRRIIVESDIDSDE
jgi:hypothetical protein